MVMKKRTIAGVLAGTCLLFLAISAIPARNCNNSLIPGGNKAGLRQSSFLQAAPPQEAPTNRSKATEEEVQQLLSQAARDLEPWKDGITLEMVERLYCVAESIDTMRIQVVNGKPYLVGPNSGWQSRFYTMQKQILDLTENHILPDVDFIISTGDQCQDWNQQHRSKDNNFDRCPKNAPLFSFCKHKYHTSCVTMPEFSFGGWPEAYMPDWQSTRAWMLLAAKNNPFKSRSPKLFWRGADTNTQRRIMEQSGVVKDSQVMDVHTLNWGDHKEEFISLPEHCEHRQLMHLGGISYSARLRNLLLCGSPVLFPYDDDWEPKEFWYHMLENRKNVVLTGKVTEGNWGKNVVDLAEELAANDELAEEIGRNGQHLAAEILHPENVQRYWVELLTQYSKIQTFQPTVHTDATPLEIALMRPPKVVHSRDRTCNLC